MLKAIIFDFDGTIADSEGLMIEIVNQYSKKYKYRQIDYGEINSLKGRPLREVIPTFKIPFFMMPFLIRDVLNRFGERSKEIKIFSGVEALINRLSEKGYDLYIVSSNKKENIEKFLKNNRVNVFKSVYSSFNIFGKDRLINKLLKNEKLSLDECIYVGDEVRDIDACRKVGLKIVSVTWGYNVDSALKKFNPDFVIDNTEDLYNTLSCL